MMDNDNPCAVRKSVACEVRTIIEVITSSVTTGERNAGWVEISVTRHIPPEVRGVGGVVGGETPDGLSDFFSVKTFSVNELSPPTKEEFQHSWIPQ